MINTLTNFASRPKGRFFLFYKKSLPLQKIILNFYLIMKKSLLFLLVLPFLVACKPTLEPFNPEPIKQQLIGNWYSSTQQSILHSYLDIYDKYMKYGTYSGTKTYYTSYDIINENTIVFHDNGFILADDVPNNFIYVNQLNFEIQIDTIYNLTKLLLTGDLNGEIIILNFNKDLD